MSFSSVISSSPVSTLPGGKAYGQPDDDEDDNIQPPSQDDGTQAPAAPTSAAAYFASTSPFKSQAVSTPSSSPATADPDTSNLSAASYFAAQKPSLFAPPTITPPRPIPSAPAPAPAPAPPQRPNYTTLASNPVLAQAFAPEIEQERQSQAQDAVNQRADAVTAQRTGNAQMRAYSATDYLRTTRDGNGNIVPLTDPDSGKPLYKPHTGDVQYDEDGTPSQVSVDQFGNQTRTNPDANAPVGPISDDLSDPQLYRQNKFQAWQPLGHVDDLANDQTQPPNVRATAAKWQLQRGAAIRQSAVQAARSQAANLQAQHVGVQNQLASLNQQIDALSPTYDAQTNAPLNDVARDAATASQTAGGVFGIGASPTDDATAAAARNADRAQQLAGLQQQQQQLVAQVGTARQPGPLPLAVKAAQADAEITEHSLDLNNYATMADQRRTLLKTEGKSADDDPVLAAIVKKSAALNVKVTSAQQAHDAIAQQAAATGQDIGSLYTRTSLNGDPAAPGPSSAPAPVQAFSPSVPGQPTSVAPFTPNDPPYRVDDQGQLSFNPARMVAGITAARDAGLIDPAKAATLLPQAKAAQDAAQAQQATVNELNAKEASAGNYAQGKALLTGASKAVGFLSASAPGVAAGETVGAALAPFTFGISAVAGPVIGGLITGTLGSMAVDKTERALAKHSDIIRSFTDASDLHPLYDLSGNLLAFGAGLPKVATTALSKGVGAIADAVGDNAAGRAAQLTSDAYAKGTGSLVDTVQNLSSQASVQAAGGATTGQIVGKIAGQVGKSVGANVAIDTAIKEGGRMLGLSDDHQTWGGALQAAAVGAFLSGHGIEVGHYDQQQVGDILARGKAAQDAGQKLTSALAPAEVEIFQKAADQLEGNPNAQAESARQATLHGQSYGVASVNVEPRTVSVDPADQGTQQSSGVAVPPTSPVPPVALGSDSSPSAAPTTGQTSARANSGGTPSGVEEGGQPSAGSTAALPAGQASSPTRVPAPGDTPRLQGEDAPTFVARLRANGQEPSASLVQRRFNLGYNQTVDLLKSEPTIPAPTVRPPAALVSLPPEQVAADFASRNPGAPRLDPLVIQKSHEFVPPGQESVPEPQARADARLAATQQIAALPDAPPTTDGHGQPTANPDSARARDTASALFKLASGFEVDHLTAAEQARLKPKGEPPLARKAPDGDMILTDAGRQHLTQAAPAAASFIDGSEADELRARAQPTPTAPTPEAASSTPPAPPATGAVIPGLDPAPVADIPPVAPRQEVRTASAPKHVEPTSPLGIEAKRRITILEQRQFEAQQVGADITPGQKASLAGARAKLAEELAKQPPPPPSTARQAMTPAGKRSQEILAHFDAVRERGDTLNEHQERARDEAQRTLDQDHNLQMLGPEAQPTSPKGQRALRDYLALTKARDSGVYMSRGDHEAIRGHLRTIRDDFTAQRKAIEAREAGQPRQPASIPGLPESEAEPATPSEPKPHPYTQRARNAQKKITEMEALQRDLRAGGSDLKPGQKDALGNLRAAHAAELAKPPPDDLAVGDVIQGKKRYTVSDLGDETHVGITAPDGPPLKMLRADALKGRIERAGEPGTPRSAATIPGLEHLSTPAPGIEVPAGMGDKPSVVRARAWIADQRRAGRDFRELLEALGKQFGIGLDRARTLVAEQAAAEQGAQGKAPVPAKPAPRFTENQRVIVAGRAGTVEKINGDRATVRLRPTPTMASEVREVPVSKLRQPPARSFQLPDAPMGQPDVIDHIHEQGGMLGKTEAERIAKGKGLPGGAGASYDDLPDLKGIYQQKVFGGKMSPDQMAAYLHDERGVGDGSVGGMYRAIDEAMQGRRSAKVGQAKQAVVEQQAGRFDKDALTAGTAKGKTEINTSNLSVGDKVQVGDQTLTVRDIDPDSLDVELEDHSKYGVQRVADGQSLFVEKVESNKGSLAAANPGAPEERQPMTRRDALNIAKAHLRTHWPLLQRLGIKRIEFAPTRAGSGVEFGGDQVLRIDPEKLAVSMEDVHDMQNSKGIDSTPEQWFAQVLFHEGIHGAQVAVARSKGMTWEQYHDSLPDEAMPRGWQEAGRKAYGSEWDSLKGWQRKAEFSRMVLEKGWTGRISEALYRHLKNTVDFLRRVVGHEGTDPIFRQHIEEVAQRLEEARKGSDGAADWQAFPPESGTLGVPRDQMPQIANEHRGPFVQFLKGQGMTVHAAPVDPRTLQPSQAEFSPAKVEQARNYTGTKRPIIYSQDGHVIDGHHQWVQALQDAPDKPIPGVRINAPARDILSRIHEFPSAGMDGPLPQLRPGERQGDLLSSQSEDLRLVGEQGIDHGARQAAQEQAQRATAEARAAQDRDQGTLFAAAPARGMRLREAGRDFPRDDVAPKLLSVRGTNEAIARQAAREFQSWPREVRAADGSTVTLNNPEGGSLGARVRHLLFDNTNDRLDPAKSAWLPAVPDTLANAAVRLVDPVSGNRVYVREYNDGTKHMVVVKPDGTVQEQKAFTGSLITQFPGTSAGRQGDMRMDWVRPEGNGTGLQQPASGPTPVESNEGNVSPRPVFRKDIIPPRSESQDTVGAAKPGAEGDESDGGVLGRIREKINVIGQAIAQAREQSQQHGDIKARFDSIDNLARMAGQQAGGEVRLDLPNDLDRQAAGAVVEAGYHPKKLAADLAAVKDSPDQKLAARYTPIYQHALDNLDRLRNATQGYRDRVLREDNAAEAAGLPPSVRARIEAQFDDPHSPEATIFPDKGFGATKGYKTAADAIAAGVDPVSTDLADLAERRVGRNQSAINQHGFEDSLAGMKASDGKPALASIEDSSTRLNPDGSATPTAKVPTGYEAVQAGNNVLVAHKEFAPVLKALYGQSDVQGNRLGSKLLDAAAFAKHGTVGIGDTYHLMRTAMRALTGFQTSGYGRGLAVHEFSDADLPRAVKAGEITQKEADYAKANRAAVERGIKAGLNTGKVADNLLEAARQHNLVAHLPLVGGHLTRLNDFIFHQFQRGSMTQAYVVAEARNRVRYRDQNLNEHEIARRSAKEVNEFYGNLGSQGFLASKTMQDLAKLMLFSPGFTEGSLRTEGRAIGQAGRIPVDLARGKGLRAGVVAQAMGGMVLSGIVASQALNLFTKGQPTWKNEEDGHQWDAWIPGGPHNKGFFFSPLSIAAEYSHALTKYMGGGESALDAVAHVASNKLSGPARAVKDLAGGTDYRGQPYGSTGDRVRAAVGDALPLPMPAGPFITKDPKSATGYALNHQKGALEKAASGDGRAEGGRRADTRARRCTGIADAYRPKVNGQPGGGGTGAAHPPSAYSDLRHALSDEDDATAKDEIRKLVADGHPIEKILGSVGLRSDSTVAPEYFTGSAETERKMFAALPLDQRKLWAQAQAERKADAEKLRQLTRQMLPELAAQHGRALQPAQG